MQSRFAEQLSQSDNGGMALNGPIWSSLAQNSSSSKVAGRISPKEHEAFSWSGTATYRFGFQGQEKDDEIHGATGTSYAFEFRMHDPRIGRFLSIDPLAAKYPYNSPYAFSENRVIASIELEGLESFDLNGGGSITGPYKDGKSALGAALNEGNSDGTGTASIDLPDLVVTREPSGSSSPSATLAGVAGAVGTTEAYYGLGSEGYDHSNYVTTTGKTRPIFKSDGTVRSLQAQRALSKSNLIRGTGLTLSFASTALGYAQIYDQYQTGGAEGISPVDATATGVGTVGLVANASTWLGYGGSTVAAVGSIAGYVSVGFAIYQAWQPIYKPMDDLRFAPSYRADSETLLNLQRAYELSGGNDPFFDGL